MSKSLLDHVKEDTFLSWTENVFSFHGIHEGKLVATISKTRSKSFILNPQSNEVEEGQFHGYEPLEMLLCVDNEYKEMLLKPKK